MGTSHFVTQVGGPVVTEETNTILAFDLAYGSDYTNAAIITDGKVTDSLAVETFGQIDMSSNNPTMGDGCDEWSDTVIVERNGVYYLSMDPYSLLDFDNDGALILWFMQRTASDRIVIDLQGHAADVSEANPYRLCAAASVLGVIMTSPAQIKVRIGGVCGGFLAYVPLLVPADCIEVGELGELILSNVADIFSSQFTRCYQHFIEVDIFGAARDRGVLTDDEYNALIAGQSIVRITGKMLKERIQKQASPAGEVS